MPERWKLGIICPTYEYKKGDKLECGNYRDITLLSAAYKVLTSIINETVQKVTERIIGEYQCGFRPNKGTTDQLFIGRKLSETMQEVGIPQQLIKLIEMTLRDTKAAVKIDNRKTRTFDFSKYQLSAQFF